MQRKGMGLFLLRGLTGIQEMYKNGKLTEEKENHRSNNDLMCSKKDRGLEALGNQPAQILESLVNCAGEGLKTWVGFPNYSLI